MNRDGQRVARSATWTVRLLMIFGLLTLVPRPGVPALTGVVGMGLLVLGWMLQRPGRWESAWRLANAAAAVLALVLVFLFQRPWGEVAMLLVVYLMVHRAWTASHPSDHRVALLLSALLSLLGSTLTDSAWLAPLHVGMVALLPVALLWLHTWDVERLRPARGTSLFTPRRGMGLGFGVLALVVVSVGIFITLPRLQGGAMASWGTAISVSGFSDQVELGDLGAIQTNPSPVMQVEVRQIGDGTKVRPPLRMRGVALDVFDGTAWRRSGRLARWRVPDRPQSIRDGDLVQEVLLEPIGEPVMFGLPWVQAIRSEGVDLVGTVPRNVRHLGETRRHSYRVWSRPHSDDPERLRRAGMEAGLNRAARHHFTHLPADLDPRIESLARGLVEGHQAPFDKARAIETHLRDNYTYTDVPQVGHQGQPLSDFLFETRTGHCEYFATSLAVLLRAADIPANVVNGFYGGDWNEITGFVTLRQSDAHSWVEVHMGSEGWVTLDATPEALPSMTQGWPSQLVSAFSRVWRQWVVDYDLNDQLALLSLPEFQPTESAVDWGLVAPLVPVGVLMLLVGVLPGLLRGLVLREPRPPRRRGVEAVLQRAWLLVERRGHRIPLGLPPVAAASWLVESVGEVAEPLRELAWCHYRVRYGEEMEPALLRKAQGHLDALKGLPRAG